MPGQLFSHLEKLPTSNRLFKTETLVKLTGVGASSPQSSQNISIHILKLAQHLSGNLLSNKLTLIAFAESVTKTSAIKVISSTSFLLLKV